MKSKKYLFKKFHRKYAFLQSSLFDFLLWRNSTFNLHEKNTLGDNFHKKKIRPGLLQVEKISFQEYWKNSENKKIQNTFQTVNREFLSQKKLQKRSTKTNPSKVKFQSFYLINFQKNLSSRTSSRLRNCMNETFLPQTDSFVQRTLFSPFQNLKIGQFFPMKLHFQQYWIFPLLGFVLFFSSNFEKKINPKVQGQPNSFLFSTLQKKPNSQKDKTCFKQSFSSQLQKPTQTFSFSQKKNFFSSKEEKTDFSFFENQEFTEVANFYLKFFRTSLSSSSDEPFDSQIFKQYLEKNSLHGKKMKTLLRQKRNTFQWTWFSVNPSSFSYFQKDGFLTKHLQIPQKAQFFSSNNREKFVFFSQKNNNVQKKTPIFEFSTLDFFFNDFERNFTLPTAPLMFEKTPFLLQNSPSIDTKIDILKNSAISTFETKNFLMSFENDNLESFNFLFSKKINNSDCQQGKISSNTFFFLEKWFETQQIWQLQKKEKAHNLPKRKTFKFWTKFSIKN